MSQLNFSIGTFSQCMSFSPQNIKIDNSSVTKISDYISKLNVVLFNREDSKLIKDNPSTHRKLINMELSEFNNEYLKLLSIYNKIMKQIEKSGTPMGKS